MFIRTVYWISFLSSSNWSNALLTLLTYSSSLFTGDDKLYFDKPQKKSNSVRRTSRPPPKSSWTDLPIIKYSCNITIYIPRTMEDDVTFGKTVVQIYYFSNRNCYFKICNSLNLLYDGIDVLKWEILYYPYLGST